MSGFRLPTNKQRVAVVGRTGSGKTVYANWLLSHAPFDTQPYIIYDYKGDDFINSIPYLKHIDTGEVPKQPGLYAVHPQPEIDNDRVENQLWNIWRQERTGVYIDEMYMLEKDSAALSGMLTQGRSKQIPMICLTQRPAWVSRFIFSESDYFSIFHLNDKRDHKTVEQFLPESVEKRLPDYHSRWFDVAQNKIFIVTPVPPRDSILARFEERLRPKKSQTFI